MKTLFKTWIAAAALLAISVTASAQQENNISGSSPKGYWVIETNVKTPLQNIVRFYTVDDMLVYTEKVDGVRLNAEKKKIRRKLNEVLQTAITAWERNKTPEMDKNYVRNTM